MRLLRSLSWLRSPLAGQDQEQVAAQRLSGQGREVQWEKVAEHVENLPESIIKQVVLSDHIKSNMDLEKSKKYHFLPL